MVSVTYLKPCELINFMNCNFWSVIIISDSGHAYRKGKLNSLLKLGLVQVFPQTSVWGLLNRNIWGRRKPFGGNLRIKYLLMVRAFQHISCNSPGKKAKWQCQKCCRQQPLVCPSMASEVPPSSPWWSSTQLRRTPAQGSWGKGITLPYHPSWAWNGLGLVVPRSHQVLSNMTLSW